MKKFYIAGFIVFTAYCGLSMYFYIAIEWYRGAVVLSIFYVLFVWLMWIFYKHDKNEHKNKKEVENKLKVTLGEYGEYKVEDED